MTVRRPDPPFTLTVEAGFSEDGVWTIDARLKFRDDAAPLGILGLGRLALLEGILCEVQRGQSLGANQIRIHMVGHDGVRVRTDAGDGPVDVPPELVVPEPDSIN